MNNLSKRFKSSGWCAMKKDVNQNSRLRNGIYKLYKKNRFIFVILTVIVPQFALMDYLLYWAPDFLLHKPEDLYKPTLRAISVYGFILIFLLLGLQILFFRWIARADDSTESGDE